MVAFIVAYIRSRGQRHWLGTGASDNEKAILIFTETHLNGVFERTNTRRGIASTYTVDGNHLRVKRLIDTATNVSPQGEMEFQIEGDTMTWKLLTPGTVSPVGHVDVWRKIG